jgi:hypothetical protein
VDQASATTTRRRRPATPMLNFSLKVGHRGFGYPQNLEKRGFLGEIYAIIRFTRLFAYQQMELTLRRKVSLRK